MPVATGRDHCDITLIASQVSCRPMRREADGPTGAGERTPRCSPTRAALHPEETTLDRTGRHPTPERKTTTCAESGRVSERKTPSCADLTPLMERILPSCARHGRPPERILPSCDLVGNAQLGLSLSTTGPSLTQLRVFLSGTGLDPAQLGLFLSGTGPSPAQLGNFLSGTRTWLAQVGTFLSTSQQIHPITGCRSPAEVTARLLGTGKGCQDESPVPFTRRATQDPWPTDLCQPMLPLSSAQRLSATPPRPPPPR